MTSQVKTCVERRSLRIVAAEAGIPFRTAQRWVARKGDPRWAVCGLPDVLYVDHGSDFISHHLEQVGADLKIRLVFSLPGKPRGRGRIERFFSTVNEMFLCELDGYSPAGGPVRGKPHLTLPELEAQLPYPADGPRAGSLPGSTQFRPSRGHPVSRLRAAGYSFALPKAKNGADGTMTVRWRFALVS